MSTKSVRLTKTSFVLLLIAALSVAVQGRNPFRLFQGPLPIPNPIVTGLAETYCDNSGVKTAKITNIPADSTGIFVLVKLNNDTLVVSSDSTFSFNVDTLNLGNHIITVSFIDSQNLESLVHNFDVKELVNPDVNLTVSNAVLINDSDVTITATNAWGGGTTPLFTFARDRTITNLIQPEGSSATVNFDPSDLPEGITWIYVRMRTSLGCYLIQTNVDSVKLTRVFEPQTPVVSGLFNAYCITAGTEKGKITNLPSVISTTSVQVNLDGNALIVDADSTFSFPIYVLTAGGHAITVTFTNAAGTKTFTHNFNVTAAGTPDVNVTSNITTILTLATPVVVTASNAAAGGAAPKYAFAKDRNFTQILQVEGTLNTLTIDPGTLTIGDNWVYARMRSSDLCVTADVNIDSIKLVRDITTGITDPDNPGKIINLYPNPFAKQIYITGLSAAKTYTLSISNLNGQLIRQVKINGRTNTELVFQNEKPGTYLLSIYDEKKKQLLGSAKLIKR